MQPKLKLGKASCKKKPTDKYISIDVSPKDIEKTTFSKTIFLYGFHWNQFNDIRGYTWIQIQ